MAERVLLKLGGSVITDKSGDCTIRYEAISTIAREIAVRRKSGLLIVHGAGSCGHPEASRYRLAGGVTPDTAAGIFLTHRSVRRLNEAVVGALRGEGLEAVGVHPLSAWLADRGEIAGGEYGHLEQMLSLGLTPVLHGDVVMDRSRGACIISGDQLVRRLAPALGIRRIGLATDVAGLLGPDGVVPEIRPGDTVPVAGASGNVDVTGGMAGKLRELLLLAEDGIGSDIFSIARIGDFLDGRPHGGTMIRGKNG